MRAPTLSAADLTPVLAAYARRLHASVDTEHHVASPLGAWMLLALCAAGSDGRLRDELTSVLGVDVDAAAAFAAALLGAPHPAVAFAAGVWTSRQVAASSAAGWLAGLPSPVDRGTLPGQAALDAWVKSRTRGMIRHLPAGEVTPDTMLIVATALATNVTWDKPFIAADVAQPGLIGSTMWSGGVREVLKAPASHDRFIAATERAGDVGVHVVDTEEGMSVTSVIAARDVPPSNVIATAYEIGCGRHVAKRSLFDLPLGNSPTWRITEHAVETAVPNGREEQHEAVLPAWRAEGRHDLRRVELGFPAAAAALQPIIGFAGYPYAAMQAVVARYSRTGFSAAALSELRGTLSRMANPPRRPGLLRVATLQFGHPFAVVAATTDSRYLDGTTLFGPWHRVPVYSAWVAEPTEANEALEDTRLRSAVGRIRRPFR